VGLPDAISGALDGHLKVFFLVMKVVSGPLSHSMNIQRKENRLFGGPRWIAAAAYAAGLRWFPCVLFI